MTGVTPGEARVDRESSLFVVAVALVLVGAALAWVMSRRPVALLFAFLCALEYARERWPDRGPLIWLAGGAVFFLTAIVAEVRRRPPSKP